MAIDPIDVPGSSTLAKVGEYQVTRPGCYSYAGLLTGKVGGETVWTVDHPVGQASQTTLVAEPTVATIVSTQKATVGETISDTVEVVGLADISSPTGGLTATLTGALLGPVQPFGNKCDRVDWSGAPVAAPIKASSVTVQGSGSFTKVGEFTIPKGGGGCYTYTETLTGTVNGQTVWTVVHEPGEDVQTSIVAEPKLVTQTSAQLVAVNSSLSDKITVSDMGGYTGELTMALYGPYVISDDASCTAITADQWSDAVRNRSVKPVASAQTIDVTSDGDYQTNPVTVTTAGCHTWGGQLDVKDTTKIVATSTDSNKPADGIRLRTRG